MRLNRSQALQLAAALAPTPEEKKAKRLKQENIELENEKLRLEIARLKSEGLESEK